MEVTRRLVDRLISILSELYLTDDCAKYRDKFVCVLSVPVADLNYSRIVKACRQLMSAYRPGNGGSTISHAYVIAEIDLLTEILCGEIQC